MIAHAESFMAECRVRLAQAALCERRGEIELADAYGAEAANKVAIALHLDRKESVITPMVRP